MNKIKILFVLLGMCLAIPNVSAQNASQVKFMGVELDGEMNAFVDSLLLKNSQLTIIEKSDTIVKLKGKYYRFNDVDICINSIDKNPQYLGSVYLSFGDDSWASLAENIEDYLELLNEKYGKPKNAESYEIGIFTMEWEFEGVAITIFSYPSQRHTGITYYSKKLTQERKREKRERLQEEAKKRQEEEDDV